MCDFAERLGLFLQLVPPERLLDHQPDLAVHQRLGDVVSRAALDRLHGIFDRPVAGDQHEGEVGVRLPDGFEELEARAIGHVDVGED